jgi:hypothetical protein
VFISGSKWWNVVESGKFGKSIYGRFSKYENPYMEDFPNTNLKVLGKAGLSRYVHG